MIVKTNYLEFVKWYDLLTTKQIETPWLFSVKANRKDPDGIAISKRRPANFNETEWCIKNANEIMEKNNKNPKNKTITYEQACDKVACSWKSPHACFTKEEAIERLKQGGNIGIASRDGQRLVIYDKDTDGVNDKIVTLTSNSSSGIGGHVFGFSNKDDESLNTNIPAKDGEVRSCDQYVLACGSYVPCEGKSGMYTIDNPVIPVTIKFEDLPDMFLEQVKKNKENIERIKKLPKRDFKAIKGVGKQSALFELTIEDVVGAYSSSERFTHPLHSSVSGHNFSVGDGIAHCWRHLVSLNPIQFLCVKANYLECEDAGTGHNKNPSASAVVGDNGAIFFAWKQAKIDGLIPEDDKIPTKAIRYIVEKHKLMTNIDNDKLLPSDIIQQCLIIVEKEHKIKTGRELKPKNKNVEITETVGGEDFNLPKFDYNTAHLKQYKEFVGALSIRGDQYTVINKLFWYQMNAAPIKLKKFRLGELEHDLRINILLPLPMAKGKNEYKTVTSDILKRIGNKCYEPEISHIEQMIGGMIEVYEDKEYTNRAGETKTKSVKKWVANPGWLINDLLQFDESHQLLSSDRDTLTDARRHIRKATNPYGKNLLQKKLTKNKENEMLEYYSPTQFQFYTQPKFLEPDFVEDGTARRTRIPYVPMAGSNQSNLISDKLRSKKDITGFVDSFVQHLVSVKTVVNEWEFTEEALNTIDNCQREMSSMFETLPRKVRAYALGLGFQNTEDLIRCSCIIAASNFENVIQKHHVLLAYTDVVEFAYHSLYYVHDRVQGSFDYGMYWKGATGADQQALMFLAEHKALDEQSSIELKKFKDYVQDLFGVSPRQVTDKVNNYEVRGWVKTKHDYQNYTVYLAFKPKNEHDSNVGNASNPKNAKILNFVKQEYEDLVKTLGNGEGDVNPLAKVPNSDSKKENYHDSNDSNAGNSSDKKSVEILQTPKSEPANIANIANMIESAEKPKEQVISPVKPPKKKVIEVPTPEKLGDPSQVTGTCSKCNVMINPYQQKNKLCKKCEGSK